MGNITIHSAIKFKDLYGSIKYGIVLYIDKTDSSLFIISEDFKHCWASCCRSEKICFKNLPEDIKFVYNSIKKYMLFYDDEYGIHKSVLDLLSKEDILDLLKNRKILSDLLCGTEVYK